MAEPKGCPICGGKQIHLSSRLVGSAARCKSCGATLRVRRIDTDPRFQPGPAERPVVSPISDPSHDGSHDSTFEASDDVCDAVALIISDGESPETVLASREYVPHPATTAYSGRRVDLKALRRMEADTPLEWKEGDIIVDLYEVAGLLGEGGMGKVYKVRHRIWDVDLAVKSPKPEIVAGAGGPDIFKQEAQTWVNLGMHPNVVGCHYVRELGGAPRLFAEYVSGGSLHDWIADRRLYEGGPERALERILDVSIQFAEGLRYSHEQGLVNQDVKPANVLITHSGVAKITDFGLAGAKAEPWTGTPAYMSPEQWDAANKRRAGAPADYLPRLTEATDIWSWAVSVLEMFVGEISWRSGGLAGAVLEKLLKKDRSDSIIPTMPVSVARLLGLCLKQDPSDRPGNMQEILDRLKDVYEEEIGETYPRPEPEALPDGADSLNNRAVSMLDLGLRDEAEQFWAKALERQSDHPESTYNRELLRWREAGSNDEDMINAMQNLRRSRPTDWITAYLLAQACIERTDYEDAVRTLEEIGNPESNRDEVRTALGEAMGRVPHTRKRMAVFLGHAAYVTSVCFCPEGERAISASNDKTLRLWNVGTGLCVRTFKGHAAAVTSVSVSDDGYFALSGSNDKTLRLWEIGTGRCLRTFEGHSTQVNSVCISPDGRHGLSGGSGNTVRLWEMETGRCLRTFLGHTGWVTSVSVSPDGLFGLSAGEDNTLRLWELETGLCVRTFEGHTDRVTCACLSKDGLLALSASEDHTLRLWEVAGGACLRTLKGHSQWVTSACLTPDGRYALSGGDDMTLRLWDVTSGRCLRTFRGNGSSVTSLAMSSDGKHAMSGTDGKSAVLWFVNPAGHKPAAVMLTRVKGAEQILSERAVYETELTQAVQYLDRGHLLAAAGCLRRARQQPGHEREPKAMELWTELYAHLPRSAFTDAQEAETAQGREKGITFVHLSHDGRFVLSGSYAMNLGFWDVSKDRRLVVSGRLGGAAVSGILLPNARRALSGHEGGMLQLWDLEQLRSVSSFEGHRKAVQSVGLSGDGCFALSGSVDRTVRLWHIETGRCARIFQGHQDTVTSVLIGNNGRFALSGSADKTMRLWDIVDDRCRHIYAGHSGSVTCVDMSYDGRFALSGGDDMTLRFWNVADARCLSICEGHEGPVTCVSMSFEGRFALSGGADKTMRLWDLHEGKLLRTFGGHREAVKSVCLSSDGRFAISTSADMTFKRWTLDWDLEDREPAEWDEGARPYLEIFLDLHTPYAEALPGKGEISQEQITPALTRRGEPSWTKKAFQDLVHTLACAGYGWLKPEGIRAQLDAMMADLQLEGPKEQSEEVAAAPAADTEHIYETLRGRGPMERPSEHGVWSKLLGLGRSRPLLALVILVVAAIVWLGIQAPLMMRAKRGNSEVVHLEPGRSPINEWEALWRQMLADIERTDLDAVERARRRIKLTSAVESERSDILRRQSASQTSMPPTESKPMGQEDVGPMKWESITDGYPELRKVKLRLDRYRQMMRRQGVPDRERERLMLSVLAEIERELTRVAATPRPSDTEGGKSGQYDETMERIRPIMAWMANNARADADPDLFISKSKELTLILGKSGPAIRELDPVLYDKLRQTVAVSTQLESALLSETTGLDPHQVGATADVQELAARLRNLVDVVMEQ